MTSHHDSIQIKKLTVGQMQENCYVIADAKTHEAVIIDPGDDASYIVEHIQKEEMRPVAIIATHGHFDHIMAAFELQSIYGIPFCMNESDTFLLDRMSETAQHFLGHGVVSIPPKLTQMLGEGEKIHFGNHFLTVLLTPGHTPGSICLLLSDNQKIFAGDTIFAGGSVGRTDFSYSDSGKLRLSLERILALPADTVIYSGHGEETTVGQEKPYHL
jgi:hydroxyacylglutathione hydrolase